MNGRFLITGLPRCRTAWFAVACTNQHQICLHEPSATMDWGLLKTSWMSGLVQGVSDHGLAARLPEIIRDVQPRILIIERDKTQVITSMRDYLEPHYPVSNDFIDRLYVVVDQLQEALRIDHPSIMRVNFEHLKSLSLVQLCMDWLGVRAYGLGQLQHMVINSSPAYNLALLQRPAA